MSAKIQKFTKVPHCLKCDGDDLTLFYRPQMLNPPKSTVWPAGTTEEHVEIKCNDCRYIYAMAPRHRDSVTVELPVDYKTLLNSHKTR